MDNNLESIKKTLQQSINLIEEKNTCRSFEFIDEKRELDDLVQHMKIVSIRLNTKL